MYMTRPNAAHQEMGGFFGRLWDEIKDLGQKGLQQKYGEQPQGQQVPTAVPPIQQPGFFDKYGTLVAVGGAALGGMLLLRSRKKRR